MLRGIWGDNERYVDTYWSRWPQYYFAGDGAKYDDDGALWLLGRVDDVINLGGVKVDPVSLESMALAVTGVIDAAAYLIHDDKGLPKIEMALVVDGDDVVRAVDIEIRSHSSTVVPAIYRRVNSLPRNQMGKLVRHDIQSHITGGQR